MDASPDLAEPAPPSGPSLPNVHSGPAPRPEPRRPGSIRPSLGDGPARTRTGPRPPSGSLPPRTPPPDVLPAEGRPQPVHGLARLPGAPGPSTRGGPVVVPGEGWGRSAGSAPRRSRVHHRDRLAPEGRRPAPTPATATQLYGASPLGKAFWHVLSARISKLLTAGGMGARPELWPARMVTKTEEPGVGPPPRLQPPPRAPRLKPREGEPCPPKHPRRTRPTTQTPAPPPAGDMAHFCRGGLRGPPGFRGARPRGAARSLTFDSFFLTF